MMVRRCEDCTADATCVRTSVDPETCDGYTPRMAQDFRQRVQKAALVLDGLHWTREKMSARERGEIAALSDRLRTRLAATEAERDELLRALETHPLRAAAKAAGKRAVEAEERAKATEREMATVRDQLRDAAEVANRAEAEVARMRPVVEAALRVAANIQRASTGRADRDACSHLLRATYAYRGECEAVAEQAKESGRG